MQQHLKQTMFVGSYIFYDSTGKLRYGAEYGQAPDEDTFVRAMHEDIAREYPGATRYEGCAWKMSDQGMADVARFYMQRYVDQEYGE